MTGYLRFCDDVCAHCVVSRERPSNFMATMRDGNRPRGAVAATTKIRSLIVSWNPQCASCAARLPSSGTP